MKRFIKRVIVTCLLAVVLLSLCSCNMLDELKNKHVIYDENSPETLEFRGEKYERIRLKPLVILNCGLSETVYAEKRGFPILLLDEFGAYSVYCEEKDIFHINSYGHVGGYFAHEDKAEEYRKMIENNDLSYLKFDYYEYDQTLQKRIEKSYILEEELMKNISELTTSGEVSQIDSSEILHCLELIRCDETNLLESELNGITIVQSKNGGFFVKNGTLKYDDKLEGIVVPTVNNEDFVRLMNDAKNKGAENFGVYYYYED